MSKLMKKEQEQTESGWKTETGAKGINLVKVVFPLILIALIILFAGSGYITSQSAAKDAYQQTRKDTEDEVYQTFYQNSYDRAEKRSHVKNQVSLTIDQLQQQSKLEVLKVSTMEYAATDEENPGNPVFDITAPMFREASVWLVVPATGVFTVNMKAGEFIVDEAHRSVLVRVPKPELGQFTIDYPNVQTLRYSEAGFFNRSEKKGEDEARTLLTNAELSLRQSAESNQEFQKYATNTARKIIAGLVRELNPSVPELVVDVEFVD
jgi:hypothetical protein